MLDVSGARGRGSGWSLGVGTWAGLEVGERLQLIDFKILKAVVVGRG